MNKYQHVRYAKNTDHGHHCHWPGCDRQVKPAVWGCREHWYMLPKDLRDLIWKSYRPGQEETKTPSLGYVLAAREVQRWIETRDRPWVRELEYDL